MKVFKEVSIGRYVLRFYPSDTGWMCGISNEMMDAISKELPEIARLIDGIKVEAENGLVIGDKIGMRDALETIKSNCCDHLGIEV